MIVIQRRIVPLELIETLWNVNLNIKTCRFAYMGINRNIVECK